MIRFIVTFTVALGLSLGVSTGWVIVGGKEHSPLTNPTVAKQDSVKSDLHTDSAQVLAVNDTTSHGSSTKASEGAASTEAVAITQDAEAQDMVASSAQSKASATDTQNNSVIVKRLASIFASMPARDAARVLTEMDNDDVQTILFSLPRKQQAAILSSLPANRAALITKATLRDTL
jgi:Mg/Co/Ni transporter MgtE